MVAAAEAGGGGDKKKRGRRREANSEQDDEEEEEKMKDVHATTPEKWMSKKWICMTAAPILPICVAVVEARTAHEAAFARIMATLLASAPLALLALLSTLKLIPLVAAKTQARGMFGYDLNKRGTPMGEVRVPESAGLAAGTALLVSLSLSLMSGATLESTTLMNIHAAIASTSSMLFLGFVDDVLDIPWRLKLILPTLGALPLLAAYNGSTDILLPIPLRAMLGMTTVPLGYLYHVYMLLLTVFATNAINILAGVNGLEAGQSLILSSSIAAFNVIQIAAQPDPDSTASISHQFSLRLMLIFGCVSMGVLRFNWYPSKVFVGDSYTYLAGMSFAVAGILGHFSETLLLMMLPQVFNFVYSLPQLFKLVPCPRHRLPRLDPKTGLLYPTYADPERKIFNMNVVTLALRIGGPCREETLTVRLMIFQALCCASCFAIRALLSGWYK